jgi:hypothetical protein
LTFQAAFRSNGNDDCQVLVDRTSDILVEPSLNQPLLAGFEALEVYPLANLTGKIESPVGLYSPAEWGLTGLVDFPGLDWGNLLHLG